MSDFSLDTLWTNETAEHKDVAEKTFATLQQPFSQMLELCIKALEQGGKILFLGNGGSAADAQHLATELTIRFTKDRKALASIALTTDTSTLTACANDMGFDQIFARQIEALGKPEDVLIAISTSGNSGNIVEALKTARSMDLKTIGLSGRDGGKMLPLCDVMLIVPSNTTARIQEMHITLGHMLCGALEQKMGLV